MYFERRPYSNRNNSIANSPNRRASRRRRARMFELLEPRLVMTGNNPVITEFMASNDSTINDGRGVSADWIEIHNPTSQTINLAGWHLTDESDNLDKWTFPSLPQSVLDPGEYLVVFASNQDTETYVDRPATCTRTSHLAPRVSIWRSPIRWTMSSTSMRPTFRGK
jgi:hypothetical protein